jgi:hypothetical protein
MAILGFLQAENCVLFSIWKKRGNDVLPDVSEGVVSVNSHL